MKTSKKLTTFLLAAVLAVGLVPTASFATERPGNATGAAAGEAPSSSALAESGANGSDDETQGGTLNGSEGDTAEDGANGSGNETSGTPAGSGAESANLPSTSNGGEPSPATNALVAARAATNVTYVDASGAKQTVSATVVTSGDNVTLGTDWYVVQGDVAATHVDVNGVANLILQDGATFTVSQSITVNKTSTNVPNQLHIWGCSEGTGALVAHAKNYYAAINLPGDSFLLVYGGNVTATGGSAAGIGGDLLDNPDGGTVLIYGGTVTATGGMYAAGIGGAFGGNGGVARIYGGTVVATGGQEGGAGIGGGRADSSGIGGSGGQVDISGGTVTAKGSRGAVDIGAGANCTNTGTFSTAGSGQGNAVIFATTISDQSQKGSWKGLFFQVERDSILIGRIRGGNVAPTDDFTIPAGAELVVQSGETLTIPTNTTLPSDILFCDFGGTILPKEKRFQSTINIHANLNKAWDGQPLKSSLVGGVTDVYNSDYTYNVYSSLPATTTWHADDNGAIGEQLDAAPSEPGTYWVKVTEPASNAVQEATATKQVVISKADQPGRVSNIMAGSPEQGVLHVSWDALPTAENGYVVRLVSDTATVKEVEVSGTSCDFDIDKAGGYVAYVKPAASTHYNEGVEKKSLHLEFFEVSFDADGASEAIAPQFVAEGGTATQPAVPQKEGYAFDGWRTADGAAWDFATSTVEGATTLKASWLPLVTPVVPGDTVRYLVHHYRQNTGGAAGYTLFEEEAPAGKIGNVVAADPKDYAGYVYNEGASNASGTLKAIGSQGDIVVLELYYDLATYPVTLHANGGSIPGGSDLTSYTYSIGAALPTDATRDDYVFAGWYDNEALAGDAVEAIGADEMGAKEYFAKWVAAPEGEGGGSDADGSNKGDGNGKSALSRTGDPLAAAPWIACGALSLAAIALAARKLARK